MIVSAALPKMSKKYCKMKLLVKSGSTYIVGTLKMHNRIYQDTFMFHTGYGGVVLLDPKIGEQYEMQSKLQTIGTSELKDAYGNVFKNRNQVFAASADRLQKIEKCTAEFCCAVFGHSDEGFRQRAFEAVQRGVRFSEKRSLFETEWAVETAFLAPHNGTFPCFLLGLATALFSSIAKALINFRRVSCGWITSSIKPRAAAR